MLLVLQMQHVQFLFRFLQLVFESGDLFLVGGFVFLELDLEEGKFLHSFFDPLLVFGEETGGGAILGLEGFVDVFEFDDFAVKVFKFGFEFVSFAFDEF